jgi:hypothetical protein
VTDLAAVSLVMRETEGERFSVPSLGTGCDAAQPRPGGLAAAVAEALGWVNAAFVGDPQDVRTWSRLDRSPMPKA